MKQKTSDKIIKQEIREKVDKHFKGPCLAFEHKGYMTLVWEGPLTDGIKYRLG